METNHIAKVEPQARHLRVPKRTMTATIARNPAFDASIRSSDRYPSGRPSQTKDEE